MIHEWLERLRPGIHGYAVCITFLCEHDGMALYDENYALECDLLVGYVFGGNRFWGRICAG